MLEPYCVPRATEREVETSTLQHIPIIRCMNLYRIKLVRRKSEGKNEHKWRKKQHQSSLISRPDVQSPFSLSGNPHGMFLGFYGVLFEIDPFPILLVGRALIEVSKARDTVIESTSRAPKMERNLPASPESSARSFIHENESMVTGGNWKMHGQIFSFECLSSGAESGRHHITSFGHRYRSTRCGHLFLMRP